MPLLGNNIYAEQVEQPDGVSTTVFIGGNNTPTPETWPGEATYNNVSGPSSAPVSAVSGGSFIPFASTSDVPTYDFSGMFSGSNNSDASPSFLERVVQWVKQIFS